MSLQPKPYYSFEDYLAAERESTDAKHEYVAGEVFAMTGASFNHNLITANLAGELRQQLKSRPCTVLSNDMRLRIQAADACAYPDIVVLCDKPAFYDGRKDVLTDATLLAEVFSPSTEGAQDRCAIDVFTCRPDGRWLLDAYTDPEAAIPCESIGCTLILRDVYDKVEFEPAPTPTGARPAL